MDAANRISGAVQVSGSSPTDMLRLERFAGPRPATTYRLWAAGQRQEVGWCPLRARTPTANGVRNADPAGTTSQASKPHRSLEALEMHRQRPHGPLFLSTPSDSVRYNRSQPLSCLVKLPASTPIDQSPPQTGN